MIDLNRMAQADVMQVSFDLPDAACFAQSALAHAVANCAEKMRLVGSEEVRVLLQRGDRAARGYFEYGLACQVTEHLGALDTEVQAAYLYEDEATPEDAVFAKAMPLLVHLIVAVCRKTGALDSLVIALDRAAADAYARFLDASPAGHLLDIQVVDDDEIASRNGYGALLASPYRRPLMIWQR